MAPRKETEIEKRIIAVLVDLARLHFAQIHRERSELLIDPHPLAPDQCSQ